MKKSGSILPKFKNKIEKMISYEQQHYPGSSLEIFCKEYKIKNKSSGYMEELKEMWDKLDNKLGCIK